MRGVGPRLALVVAPVLFELVFRSTYWIASFVLLLVLGVVLASGLVRHILGELATNGECDQPLEIDEPVEADR